MLAIHSNILHVRDVNTQGIPNMKTYAPNAVLHMMIDLPLASNEARAFLSEPNLRERGNDHHHKGNHEHENHFDGQDQAGPNNYIIKTYDVLLFAFGSVDRS